MTEIKKHIIILIVARLTPKGMLYEETKFKAIEKEKEYWLNRGQRRVSKARIMMPYNTQLSNLNIKAEIKLMIWCFKGQEKQAKKVVAKAIIDSYGLFKITADRLFIGMSIFLSNQLK